MCEVNVEILCSFLDFERSEFRHELQKRVHFYFHTTIQTDCPIQDKKQLNIDKEVYFVRSPILCTFETIISICVSIIASIRQYTNTKEDIYLQFVIKFSSQRQLQFPYRSDSVGGTDKRVVISCFSTLPKPYSVWRCMNKPLMTLWKENSTSGSRSRAGAVGRALVCL